MFQAITIATEQGPCLRMSCLFSFLLLILLPQLDFSHLRPRFHIIFFQCSLYLKHYGASTKYTIHAQRIDLYFNPQRRYSLASQHVLKLYFKTCCKLKD